MRRTDIYLIAITIMATMMACETNDDEPSGNGPSTEANVVVLCEGAFQGNSASISLYDKVDSEVENNAFQSVNGYVLGDVLQSVTDYNGKLYFVLNNSGKIEVAGKSSLESEAPITGLFSPRQLLPVSSNKAYISNLFTDNVQMVDLANGNITGEIDVDGWSEGMAMVDNKVFVAKTNGNQIMVIDAMTDQVMDSITVTAGPVNIEMDTDGNIWVATNGNFGAVPPKVHKIDPKSNSVVGTYDIPMPYSYAIKLVLNGDRDQVYLLNNSIYSMSIGDTGLDQEPIINSGSSYYGLGVDPDNGDIYVSNAGDFVSSGTVERYSSSGVLLDDFEAGIAPNGFYFR